MQQKIFDFLNKYGNGTDKELVDLVMNQFCIPYTLAKYYVNQWRNR